jgi:uncharacterized protein YehS (DUF1456 family)
MTNNDVIRSIRYILDINDKKVVEIIALSGFKIGVQEIEYYLRDEEDPAFQPCGDEVMSHFLDGLIFFKRGKDDSKPRHEFEYPVSNNLVLKKLRVAFALKEPDMHEILENGGYRVGRAELSAFLRKRDHPNYRDCGDQVLRYFLKGLKLRIRG